MKGSSGGNWLGIDLPTSAGTQGSHEDREAGRMRTKIGGSGGVTAQTLPMTTHPPTPPNHTLDPAYTPISPTPDSTHP
jgi:hypothetical protein